MHSEPTTPDLGTDDYGEPIVAAPPEIVIDGGRQGTAESAQAVMLGMIERRHFSAMLLAWSVNPMQQDMLPNAGLMAGVLVELCHRIDVLEEVQKISIGGAPRRKARK